MRRRTIAAVRGVLLASVGVIIFTLAPAGIAQNFSGPYKPLCLRLICSPDKSYSFDAAPYAAGTQESGSKPAAPPRPAVDSDPVREGTWRKLPSNFLHD